MSEPTLSVLMANYNHGKYIAQAIEATVSQSRVPDEYIILDDGSTDNSIDIIEPYLHQYPFIRFVRNERNEGLLAATDRQMDMASGDYVYWGAADDWVLPGFFEQAMTMAKQYPGAGIIFGGMKVVDQDGELTKVVLATKWKEALFASSLRFLNEFLKIENPMRSLSAATIYKRSALLEAGGFRHELGHWTDTFAIYAIGLKHGFCYLPEPFVSYRVISDGYFQTHRRNPKKMLDIVDKAVGLMKSSEFRERFPNEFVTWWKKGYREGVVYGSLFEAWSAFASGNVREGQEWLEEITKAVPDLGNSKDALTRSMINYVLGRKGIEPAILLKSIYANLPASEARLRSQRNRVFGELHIEIAFRAYQNKEYKRVRRHVLFGLRYDFSWVKNRGVLSILIESMIGSSLMNNLRQIAHRSRLWRSTS